MATFRIYVKRDAIVSYQVTAKTAERAEAMARRHLEDAYHLSDNITDEEGEEMLSPFEFESDDDSQENFLEVSEIIN